MSVLNTFRIESKRFNYTHYDKQLVERLKKLIKLLDHIVLKNNYNDLHILTGEYMNLLYSITFDINLRISNNNTDAFNKYYELYYILIKYKHFRFSDTVKRFISSIIVKYIENNITRFFEVMSKIPHCLSDEIVNHISKIYSARSMNYIIIHNVFPYIIESVYNNQKKCEYCKQVTKIDFIKCYECRMIYYCSNACQRNDYARHKKICLKLYLLKY